MPDNLVTTDWLAAHLSEPSVRVVDIRGYVKSTDLGEGIQHADYVGARDEYDAGHIPGAVYIDWTVDIVDLMNPVKAQIASPEAFAEAMASRGIGDETDVVIVDHAGGHFATRLWWALRYYGHDRAAVLDGGFNKWNAEGRPLETDVPTPARAVFTPKLRPELRVEPAEVLAAIDQPGSRIVDARDEPQFTGAVRRTTKGGHVPSAVNISAKALINSDGTWKPVDELRTVLADGGVRPDERVIAYCNGGVTATSVLFALARTGHDNFANYDGSWNEWGERVDLPNEITADKPA
ncbi:MAG: sulfurtransferase [Thermomicrobiales bacterium]|nr:sulfurtransferase [Thermomicrobiales bacterium]